MFLIDKFFGNSNKKIIKELELIVSKINGLEKEYEKFSDNNLKEKTAEFQKIIKQAKNKKEENEILNKILPNAFALVREAAKRTLGQRHFDCQLMGGIVLHRGEITEMKTGEGKTLTATLPIYLNALAGKGVHAITVNDYLSQRDATWMGQIYNLLGLSVGCIIHEKAFLYKEADDNKDKKRDTGVEIVNDYLQEVDRKTAYQADVVYGTNNEFGFDYLRDNMAQSLDDMAQRELNYAIIDEIDSILIDEARTPLIISAPMQESTKKYYQFSNLVKRLKEDEDYNIDEKMRAATLTEEGINKMERWLGVDNIYTSGGIRDVHHIEQALKAMTLFKRDKDYVVKDGEVIIVDEFTGRLMFGRRYSEGLHQAIEAKENLKIQQESITLATVTFQNYFRLYNKLSGMTGTALTEAEEFSKIYKLEVVEIPTNKPLIRIDKPDRIYKNEQGKFRAVIEEIKKCNKKGQPVLVGTISIEKNELLGRMLNREGIKYELLNAKNHEREAKIIADAGKERAVTVATNMAGRGVDIILGGTKDSFDSEEEWKIAHDKVVSSGGLHIIGTERHESRRIDNQLRGRSGRQGDAGSTQFFVSMEDDLMRIFGGERMKRIMEKFNFPEDMPIENKIISRSIEQAQKKVEGNNFDIRKHLVEYDDVINKHREVIYKKRKTVLALYEQNEKIREKIDKEKKYNSLSEFIFDMIKNEIDQVVMFHTAAENTSDWNLKEIYQVSNTIFPLSEEKKIGLNKIPIKEKNSNHKIELRNKIIDYLTKLAKEDYEIMKQGVQKTGLDFKNIEKEVILRAIDNLWIEHLDAIDHLRSGIGLRGYAQRDPLVEYKKEAYKMFMELVNLIQKEVVYSIYKIGLVQDFAPTIMDIGNMQMKASQKTGDENNFGSSAMAKETDNRNIKESVLKKIVNKDGVKVGRNDPCPCGSGKKYKHCCGK
ncbi:MAG: preprotein translocase subunit SecA [Xanthomonadaceae bacterium]|nr:preprotein translocase subunit SecA [Rhodospirillaceae bacterium]NIA18011.1 preprotein translocase subunit SecA [Xanthomonadaceae bacterium]